MEKRRNCSLGAISPLFHNILLPFVRFSCLSGTRLSLRDKRLFEISEFEITRVNCIYNYIIFTYYLVSARPVRRWQLCAFTHVSCFCCRKTSKQTHRKDICFESWRAGLCSMYVSAVSGKCDKRDFFCDDMCLSKALVCNGQRNCPSGADERDCEAATGKKLRYIVKPRFLVNHG